MKRHPSASAGRRRPAALLLTGLLTTALLAVAPAAATAHGEDDPATAFDLVRQAIALIVNTPNHQDTIADKIDDALMASDTSNVQLPLVQQAKDAMEAGDLHQTRRLLEQSIGARVHTGNADPVPIGEAPPAAGADTGTLAAIDAIPGRHGLTGEDWVLLAVSLAIGLGGLVFALRLRPHRPGHPSQPDTAR